MLLLLVLDVATLFILYVASGIVRNCLVSSLRTNVMFICKKLISTIRELRGTFI